MTSGVTVANVPRGHNDSRENQGRYAGHRGHSVSHLSGVPAGRALSAVASLLPGGVRQTRQGSPRKGRTRTLVPWPMPLPPPLVAAYFQSVSLEHRQTPNQFPMTNVPMRCMGTHPSVGSRRQSYPQVTGGFPHEIPGYVPQVRQGMLVAEAF
jgi:hypothetical protein